MFASPKARVSNLQAVYLTGILDDLVEIAFVCDDPKKAKKVLEEF